MQTFLPVSDFAESARLLDSPRLGKQRVETLQVLRALELPDYGWASHPAVQMWRGRTPALVAYGLVMVQEWRERGFADSTSPLIAEFAPQVVGVPQVELSRAGLLPSWVGSEELHRSHRSNLLSKDPAFYRPVLTARFGPEPDDLPYVWPGPDDITPPPSPAGARVWVVRPRTHEELGACLAAGVVGLGTRSGIDVDATGTAWCPGRRRGTRRRCRIRGPCSRWSSTPRSSTRGRRRTSGLAQ
ncbi:MSMEG_6728 family protein [Ornithinimicrobium sp. LYQ121]|uniref:MSMEG_6728 family protein n=1 Tax=Ornithinimicrobium sp. LYQ121 TaxID=3378801 RepID=UPI003852788F